MGLRSWLGGHDTPKTDADTARRVKDHRARITREHRDSKKRRQRDQTNRPRWNE